VGNDEIDLTHQQIEIKDPKISGNDEIDKLRCFYKSYNLLLCHVDEIFKCALCHTKKNPINQSLITNRSELRNKNLIL
jgi:hypothetical protein